MNVLVADDDRGCVCLVQEVLSLLHDVNVITAFDGADAWWWLTHPEFKYVLAIIDVKMPKFDGFTLVSRIRATPTLANLPVIMCSGMFERRLIGRVAELRVSEYLVKPFSPETLLDKVEAKLPRRSGRTVTIA